MSDARMVYQDIIDHPHHVSPTHPQMSRINRAAQFSPFAALSGYDDLIQESARVTESRRFLDEGSIEEINNVLSFLLQQSGTPQALFTVFIQDTKKSGGEYVTIAGTLARYDEYHQCVTLESGEAIFLDDIVHIECNAYDAVRDL